MERINRYSKKFKNIGGQISATGTAIFSLDLTAPQIVELTALNRNSVDRYLDAIRIRLAEYCEEQSPFGGTVEVDECLISRWDLLNSQLASLSSGSMHTNSMAAIRSFLCPYNAFRALRVYCTKANISVNKR